MKKWFLMLILTTISSIVIAQNVDKIFIGNRSLTWNDFKLKKNPESFDAYTATWIEYSWKINSQGEFDCQVTCYLDAGKSWVRESYLKNSDNTESNYLLLHEQGHFNISKVVSLEIEKAMKTFNFEKDSIYGYSFERVKQQADSIFNRYLDKLHLLDNIYDRETDHSNLKQEQSRWNEKIQAALRKQSFEL